MAKQSSTKGQARSWCPFCGFDEPKLQSSGSRREEKHFVECTECKARGPVCDNSNDAMVKWENRSFISDNKRKEMMSGIEKAEATKPILLENDHFHDFSSNEECPCGMTLFQYRETSDAMKPMHQCLAYKGKVPEPDMDKWRRDKDKRDAKREEDTKDFHANKDEPSYDLDIDTEGEEDDQDNV